MTLQHFIEDTFQLASPTIDRTAGIIRGVKILGTRSKNGREYSPRALRDAAAIYEGLGVNANHPHRATPHAPRTVEEGVGWLENITVKPDGIYGDLHVIKSHPLANTLFEVAERKPGRFGLSHNASGEIVQQGGRAIVESIKNVRSVDLVQNPATVNSLFESEASMPQTTLAELVAQLPEGARKRHLIRLLEDDTTSATPDTPAILPTDDSGIADLDPYDVAVESLILTVLRDPELSVEDKLDQITQILNGEIEPELEDDGDLKEPQDEADINADDETMDEPLDDSSEAVESENCCRQLRQKFRLAESELRRLRQERDARQLLEEARLEVTDKRLRMLAIVDARTRDDLLEEWSTPPSHRGSRPRFSPPATHTGETRLTAGSPPRGAQAMIAAYR